MNDHPVPSGAPVTAPGSPSVRRRLALRALELVLLFVGIPLALIPFARDVGRSLVPMLMALGTLAALALVLRGDFPARRLVSFGGVRGALPGILGRLAILGGLLTLAVLAWRPRLFLGFASARPVLFTVVLFLYPLLSAWPQEILFRAFFFRRYRSLLGNEKVLIAVNALLFGLAHAFFGNWIAPALSTAGGLLFARTYARTHSLTAAALEHALWGDLIFTIGLGRYFYGGAIQG